MIYTAEISKRNDFIYRIELRDSDSYYKFEITESELSELAELVNINAVGLILLLKSRSYFTKLTETDFVKILEYLKSIVF